MVAFALRRVLVLACLALPFSQGFDRPGQATQNAQDDVQDMLRQAGIGGVDPAKLEDAMQAMKGMDVGDIGKAMRDMASNSELMQQLKEALSDPDTQQQMLKWAENLQEQLRANPQLAAMAKQFENLNAEGGLDGIVEKLQNNPQVQEMAAQIQANAAKLAATMQEKGGDAAQGLEEAIKLGQDAFQKMMSDPEYMQKFAESMQEILPPEALENMEEQIQQMMQGAGGAGGMPDFKKLQGMMGGGAGGNMWDKDEM